MERRQKVLDYLDRTGIPYEYYEHPEAPTIDIARQYWHDDGSKHCKNLFFRNHKGNRHYLVVFDCERQLAIHDLEHRLRQGKLSFASEQRMEHYLDQTLRDQPALSFHPNDNTATVVIRHGAFLQFLESCGNSYEFIELY